MTRAAALLELHKLAHGLGATLAGCERLAERTANDEQHEELRDALIQVALVLDELAR